MDIYFILLVVGMKRPIFVTSRRVIDEYLQLIMATSVFMTLKRTAVVPPDVLF